MINKKMRILLVILCLVFSFGATGVWIFMNSIDKQTEENTTEFATTISKVEIIDTVENGYIEIYTNEYNYTLHISSNVSKNIDMNAVSDLQKNQTIFFRVENKMLDFLEEIDFCNIVSLRTSEHEIFSVSNYNEYIQNASFPARAMSLVVAGAFLLSAICFIFKKRI